MNITSIATALFVTLAGASATAWGQAQATHDNATTAASAAASAAWTAGEVRKIDSEQGKVTLKHGDIANLGMPGMTMVFKAADPKMLSGLKEGDKVRFTADKVGGILTLTTIELAKN